MKPPTRATPVKGFLVRGSLRLNMGSVNQPKSNLRHPVQLNEQTQSNRVPSSISVKKRPGTIRTQGV